MISSQERYTSISIVLVSKIGRITLYIAIMMMKWKKFFQLTFCFSAVLSQLSVTSLPAALFEVNNGMHNVVEGTVIQLYCTANSTTATFSWTKDGSPVVIDVPHLRERTCSDVSTSTATSMLTIDGFYSSDNGTYLCTAVDGASTESGSTVVLTGIVHGMSAYTHTHTHTPF